MRGPHPWFRRPTGFLVSGRLLRSRARSGPPPRGLRTTHVSGLADVLDQPLQHGDPRAVTDHVGMHGEQEHASLGVRHVEFGLPDRQDIVRSAVRPNGRIPAEAEIRGVVQNPFHRQFHDSRGFAVCDDLIGPVVRHEAGVVQEAEVPHDLQGVRAVIPGRSAQAYRARSGHLGERVQRALDEFALHVAGDLGVALVNPAVNADLVSVRNDVRHVLPVDQGAHRGNEERGANLVPAKQIQDPREPGFRPVLPPRQVGRGGVVVPERHGFVVEVEGEGYRHSRSSRPRRRGETTPGAHGVNRRSPVGLGPLPWRGFRFCGGSRGAASGQAREPTQHGGTKHQTTHGGDSMRYGTFPRRRRTDDPRAAGNDRIRPPCPRPTIPPP